MKKLNKTELKEQLNILLNTVLADCEQTEHAIISNQTYSSFHDDYIALDEASRALLLEKQTNEDHIVRRLVEILDRV